MLLSRNQSRLLESLLDYGCYLDKMYLGGLHAFNDSANPDRIAQSAHSFRELMEKVPEYINVPPGFIKHRVGYALKQEVEEIKEIWITTKKKSKCYCIESDWSGKMDCPLANFLNRLDQFFREFGENRPTRGQDFTKFRRRMDPSNEALPQIVEGLIAGKWISLYKNFTKICHHRSSPEPPKFEEYIDQLEEILTSVLIPQTVPDHETIKREIAIMEGR